MQIILILLLFVIGILVKSVNSERYIVGEGYDSRSAPYPIYYEDWGKTIKLKPGDELEFRFQKPDDLLQIAKYDYYACSPNILSRQYKDSPATVFLLVPGDYFFKSSNNTNCINGQRLYVNVAAPNED
ncbi:early nodulin-like protein 3 [Solanum dulcamara]|uniref:early nodulin-like protein 3 n=1 Tax=Solanum dulcamara TaxID=45834 RepID=UPI00248506C1|nr:early nodulin-like protein 3 [Solanum dulcamara]